MPTDAPEADGTLAWDSTTMVVVEVAAGDATVIGWPPWRLLELPLTRLLGATHESVPVYGSGGFTTYHDTRLAAQLNHWVQGQHIPRVKIKIGESWGREVARDLHRVRAARQVIGPGTELYVDANGAYTRQQAVRIGGALAEHGVGWFEEPVSSDDLTGCASSGTRCCATSRRASTATTCRTSPG